MERVLGVIKKDYILSKLENCKAFSIKYRLLINGTELYTKLSIMWASDRKHIIIGLENIDAEVRRDMEQQKALKSANEKASRDELTGVKNKNAYHDYEKEIQARIDSGVQGPFSIVLCDLNNLKAINDTYGHRVGDDYIREACRLICHTFVHSPVFRVGGDEFVAVLTENDYKIRRSLLNGFRESVLYNKSEGNMAIVASGLADFIPDKDRLVSDVFERADSEMYQNKKALKR